MSQTCIVLREAENTRQEVVLQMQEWYFGYVADML